MCKAKTQGHEHMRNTNAPDKEHYPCLLRTAVNWCVVCRGLHITLGLPSWDGRGPVHPRPPPAAAHSCMIRASRRPAERLLGCPNHHVQLTHTTPAGRLSAPGRYTPHPCTHIRVVGGPARQRLVPAVGSAHSHPTARSRANDAANRQHNQVVTLC